MGSEMCIRDSFELFFDKVFVTGALNKRARHEYFIEEEFEAGLALQGWEVNVSYKHLTLAKKRRGVRWGVCVGR